jgi:uncharacterized protein (TIGR03790 family)
MKWPTLVVVLSWLSACEGGGGEAGSSTGSSTDADPDTSTTGGTTTTIPADSGSGSTSGDPTTTGSMPTTTGEPVVPTVIFPRTSIEPEELAVIVNDDDPLSVEIAALYVAARGIPDANVVHVSLPITAALTPEQFAPILTDVQAQLGEEIQAQALTFVQPYQVGCMSITSAFTFGYDPTCGSCVATPASPYYDSPSLQPWNDHGLRPTMMLAAQTLEDAQALVQRGIEADGTHPASTAYLVRTTDAARSVRWRQMQALAEQWQGWDGLQIEYTDNADGSGSDTIEGAAAVMFYFTGLASVAGIETNAYVPGAIADHLTSFGGQVPQSGQMSALRWLEAGATASYGTVVEPCNYPEKFPHVGTAVAHYFRGETVIEAYWKSVEWPAEGLFIGEPLARPWDGSTVEMIGEDLVITTNLLIPGALYDVEAADGPEGPWEHVLTGMVPYTVTLEIPIEGADRPWYRLVPQG